MKVADHPRNQAWQWGEGDRLGGPQVGGEGVGIFYSLSLTTPGRNSIKLFLSPKGDFLGGHRDSPRSR